MVSGDEGVTTRSDSRRAHSRCDLAFHAFSPHFADSTGCIGKASSAAKNAIAAAALPTRWLNEAVTPWPSFIRVSNRTGLRDELAACSAAANLRDCHGATRGSLTPVISSTAG